MKHELCLWNFLNKQNTKTKITKVRYYLQIPGTLNIETNRCRFFNINISLTPMFVYVA